MNRQKAFPEFKRARGVVIALLGMICLAQGCASKQSTFSSADQAVRELVTAARANDKATMKKIFGPEADEVLASGDEVADRNRLNKFLSLYDEKHQLQAQP